MTFFAQALRSF